jgi:hypothetical protein
MPAPVSRTVFGGVVEDGDADNVRNSVSAAIAPLAEAADTGMIRGAGNGSVYGIRIIGMSAEDLPERLELRRC